MIQTYFGPFVQAVPPPLKLVNKDIITCLDFGCEGFKQEMPNKFCSYCGVPLESTIIKAMEIAPDYPKVQWNEVRLDVKFILVRPLNWPVGYDYWIPTHVGKRSVVNEASIAQDIYRMRDCLAHNDLKRYYQARIEDQFGMIEYASTILY